MLGRQSDQRGLWEADSLYLDHVGRGSFYGLLASMRGKLFRDEDFAELYCADNGRGSVPPSLLATALQQQTCDRASDAEAKQRADFDIRWKVALGIEVEDRPFAKSTLRLFRARLILHDRAREVFERSLRFARETGYLRGRRMKVALDTTYILGRGAVKDTYNLLSDSIVKLMRTLSELEGSELVEWATANGYQGYIGSSVKGAACIDWDDRSARAALLGEIVGDADRLLELSRQAQGLLDEDSPERRAIVEASELLGRLLLQDVERADDGVSLRQGVSRDRMVSAHDPDMTRTGAIDRVSRSMLVRLRWWNAAKTLQVQWLRRPLGTRCMGMASHVRCLPTQVVHWWRSCPADLNAGTFRKRTSR